MIFTNYHSTAPNGRIVNAHVELIEEGSRTRWRAEASVEYKTLAFSHHDTRGEAEAKAKGWHDSYIKANAAAATPPSPV